MAHIDFVAQVLRWPNLTPVNVATSKQPRFVLILGLVTFSNQQMQTFHYKIAELNDHKCVQYLQPSEIDNMF